MQHWTSLLLGLLLGTGIALLVMSVRSPSTPVHPTPRPAKASIAASHSAKAATRPADSPDAGPAAQDSGTAPPFSTLPDGSPVPKLPDSAPKRVSFGVVLFQYQGAQYAPPGARSKAEALKLARETVSLAQRDFAEAVKSGDRGSTADAGSVPRGILEAAPEYLLFTLAPGSVCPEPVDTPRGYWLMRRR
ncbi:MAG: hypothetical protein JW940_35535 [Polyangiaceae bacterium]|nr:hypothetical protein [Polyangiaceae bacterium]